jgi:anaerobic selenocysteine-containing dehydrogenase
VQWGGPRLCDGWDFPTPDGRAHFAVVEPPERTIPEGHMMMSTRRGKQFNSMVFRDHDPLTGQHRDALFISSEDAARVGVGEGGPVLVRSATGEVRARAHIARMRPGNVQMYFPESNPLIAAGLRDASGVPDYNAIVEVLPAP